MSTRAQVAAICLASLLVTTCVAADATRGQELHLTLCSGCHGVDYNSVGPTHGGVFGRKAGTASGYEYSPALQKARLVWDEANLDKWLTNPESVIPGQKMNFSVPDPADRADIIAYLKTLPP
jgi:cytochrome c